MYSRVEYQLTLVEQPGKEGTYLTIKSMILQAIGASYERNLRVAGRGSL